MQHIAPKGAACFAALAGCRLPTEAEWSFAVGADGPFNPDAANLRDQTWLRYSVHVQRRLAAERGGQPADAGAFNRSTTPPAAARSNDDGELWFAPVTTKSSAYRTTITLPAASRPRHCLAQRSKT